MFLGRGLLGSAGLAWRCSVFAFLNVVQLSHEPRLCEGHSGGLRALAAGADSQCRLIFTREFNCRGSEIILPGRIFEGSLLCGCGRCSCSFPPG